MQKINVFTDGSCRGNPGKSGAGVLFFMNGEVLLEARKYTGITTNNVSEWNALLLAVKMLLSYNISDCDITFFSDSKLMVNQASGDWKVGNENISGLYNEFLNLLKNFNHKPSFVHIPREQNSRADKLANEAVDFFS